MRKELPEYLQGIDKAAERQYEVMRDKLPKTNCINGGEIIWRMFAVFRKSKGLLKKKIRLCGVERNGKEKRRYAAESGEQEIRRKK